MKIIHIGFTGVSAFELDRWVRLLETNSSSVGLNTPELPLSHLPPN